MVTDYELFLIEQNAGSPSKARRAIYEAGRHVEREGNDNLIDWELSDTIIGLNGNYELRQSSKPSKYTGEK